MKNKLIYLLAIVAAIGGFAASMIIQKEPEIAALYYSPPRAIKPFELTANNGQAFNLSSLKDKWTLVFTGYTYCPDICPTTLAALNNNYQQLASATDNNLQVLLLSVDPQRDTTERLQEYISYFNPEFVAATAQHKDLFPFVRNLGLMYSMVDDTTQEGYLVDHSASIVLINPETNIQAIFKPEHELGSLPAVNYPQMIRDLESITNAF